MSAGAGRAETAAGDRGGGVFPVEWGIPPGEQYSEQRAAWVRRNVRQRERLTPLVAYRRLAAHDERLRWILRIAELNARRVGP